MDIAAKGEHVPIEAGAAPRFMDRFGRVQDYLRISVTDRCSLRCSYCMPPQGIEHRSRSDILTFDEILRVARLLAWQGIRKVRLTGGEPLVRRDVTKLVRLLAEIPGIEFVGMTTNGVELRNHVRELRDAGLRGLNVSLDSLRRERFRQITGRNSLMAVLAGIDAALDEGFVPLKLNTVVMKGVNDDELLDFALLARERPINVRFIEFMPFTWNGWKPERLLPCAEMKAAIEERFALHPIREPHSKNRVARNFEIDGFAGRISFIASMTESFCESCSRLRLTADGSFKTCLFYPAEVNLRGPLRSGMSDEELLTVIQDAVLRKPSGHPPLHELELHPNQTMIEIGG